MIDKVLQQVDTNLDDSLERLFALLRFPSISTDPHYKKDCCASANWLVDALKAIGFDASCRESEGNPMVVAHHEGPQPDCPHVLFYGHYDVQPVDPVELWDQQPFAPCLQERAGVKVIAARGASDDKGQLMTFVEACRAFKQQQGHLPVKVTILFEGEEESGSSSLIPFLQANAEELKADFAIVCDTNMWNKTTPSITIGLRGLLAQEVVVKAANRDLHSGYYGGAAANPITILTQALSRLHDHDGRITLPGFYDGVEETPKELLQTWEGLQCNGDSFLAPVGLSIPQGEKSRSLLEMLWARPTAEINGISGGYEGEGFKTVIPQQASAKVSFRLVHQQDPEKIKDAFQQFIKHAVPADCSVAFIDHGASPAIQLPYDQPFIGRARAALSQEWSKDAVLIASGGSIPIVGDFQTILGMQSLLVGFGLGDDNIHSPNEKYNLQSFYKGQRSWVRILSALAN